MDGCRRFAVPPGFYTKLADLDPERSSSVRISVAREVASLYSRGMSMHMNLVQGGNDCFQDSPHDG